MGAKRRNRRAEKKAIRATRTPEEKGNIANSVLSNIFQAGTAVGGIIGAVKGNRATQNLQAENTNNPINNTNGYNKEATEEWIKDNVPFFEKVSNTLDNTEKTTENTSKLTDKLPLIITGITSGIILLIMAITSNKK